MPEHSPIPWALGEEHESMCQIVDANNKIVAIARGGTGIVLTGLAPVRPHDTADRIVRAVNCHDDLVAVVEGFSNVIDHYGPFLADDLNAKAKAILARAAGESASIKVGDRVETSLGPGTVVGPEKCAKSASVRLTSPKYAIGQHVYFKTDKGRGDGIIKEIWDFGGPVGTAYLVAGCWVAGGLIEDKGEV